MGTLELFSLSAWIQLSHVGKVLRIQVIIIETNGRLQHIFVRFLSTFGIFRGFSNNIFL